MSYLNSLRLHFAGPFQTNVSTVNNDANHFPNAAYKPDYQNAGPGMQPPNGWFNPESDAAFRLLGCQIMTAHAPSDPFQHLPAQAGRQSVNLRQAVLSVLIPVSIESEKSVG